MTIAVARNHIKSQLKAYEAKLVSNDIELHQFISFCELCEKALKVYDALEEKLKEEGK